MSLVSFMGLLAAFAFLVPVIIIIYCKLYKHKSLLSLSIYFLFSAVYSLMAEDIIPVHKQVKSVFGVVDNYLDAPLMLIALMMFCTSRFQKNLLKYALCVFIAFAVLILFLFNIQPASSVYILGPAILIVLSFSIYFFSKSAKLTIEKNKAWGKTLIITSILFSYGCYGMIYYIFYIQKTSAVADTFLIYYIVSIISSIFMSIGLMWLYHRTKQIKEVQITRKELALFFNH